MRWTDQWKIPRFRSETQLVKYAVLIIGQGKVGGGGKGRILPKSGKSRKVLIPPRSQWKVREFYFYLLLGLISGRIFFLGKMSSFQKIAMNRWISFSFYHQTPAKDSQCMASKNCLVVSEKWGKSQEICFKLKDGYPEIGILIGLLSSWKYASRFTL